MARARSGGAAVMLGLLWAGGCEMAAKPVSVACSTAPDSPDIVRIQPTAKRATLLSVSPPRVGQLTVTETEYDVRFEAAAGAPALRLRINRYSLAFTRESGEPPTAATGTCQRFRERPL